MIPRLDRFDDARFAVGIQSGEQNTRFYLGGRDRRLIFDGEERPFARDRQG